MEIITKDQVNAVYRDIAPGEAFMLGGNLFIKTYENADNKVKAVNLKNGKLTWLSTEQRVTPVRALITVEY